MAQVCRALQEKRQAETGAATDKGVLPTGAAYCWHVHAFFINSRSWRATQSFSHTKNDIELSPTLCGTRA
jgi:hypothetical protein